MALVTTYGAMECHCRVTPCAQGATVMQEITPNLFSNSNLLKYRSSLTYISVIQSFGNFSEHDRWAVFFFAKFQNGCKTENYIIDKRNFARVELEESVEGILYITTATRKLSKSVAWAAGTLRDPLAAKIESHTRYLHLTDAIAGRVWNWYVPHTIVLELSGWGWTIWTHAQVFNWWRRIRIWHIFWLPLQMFCVIKNITLIIVLHHTNHVVRKHFPFSSQDLWYTLRRNLGTRYAHIVMGILQYTDIHEYVRFIIWPETNGVHNHDVWQMLPFTC